MDREEHKAWLAQMAEDDRRRRAAAEPELARKEALLHAAEGRLAAIEAALRQTEEILEQARRDLDDQPEA